MVIRGYDYGIDIKDDIVKIRSEWNTCFEERLLDSSDVKSIEYIGMVGTRIFLGVPEKYLYEESISVLVVSIIGKFIYDEYGLTYGIELIPMGRAEYFMHILRKVYEIEDSIIRSMKSYLTLDNNIAEAFHLIAKGTEEYPSDYGEMRRLKIALQELCGITTLEALNVLQNRNVSDYIKKYNRRYHAENEDVLNFEN